MTKRGVVEELLDQEPDVPTNEALKEISELAALQLELLGLDTDGNQLTSLPGKNAIGDLMDWVKDKKAGGRDDSAISLFTLSELLGAVKVRLEELKTLSETTIPEAMASVGLSTFTLLNGFELELKPDVSASIRSNHEQEAAAFLDKKGLGDVVKRELKFSLAREDLKERAAIVKLAENLGLGIDEKVGVHASTLKALVKEQLAHGVQFPEDHFNIFQYTRADIHPAHTGSKKRRSRG